MIEVGSGTGRNLIQIARRYPTARLYGLDASAEMLKTASQSLRHAGVEGRVALAHGYAENLTPALFGEAAPFDAAIFSYSLSMIPDWRLALAAAARSVAPDGLVHIVDFGDLKGLGSLANPFSKGGWGCSMSRPARSFFMRSRQPCSVNEA